MKKMKRAVALLLTLVMCSGLLAGCGKQNEQRAPCARSQCKPALQQHRAKLKRKITNRKDHDNLLNFIRPIYDTIPHPPGQELTEKEA